MIAGCSATQELDFLRDRQFLAKKNRAAESRSATRNIVDKFPIICSGRSSDLQIIPVLRLPAGFSAVAFGSTGTCLQRRSNVTEFHRIPFSPAMDMAGTTTNIFFQTIIAIKNQMIF